MVNLCPNCFAKRQNTDCCPFCHYRYNDLPDDNASLRQMTVLNHRYIIGRVLGVGGFGVTYLALNNETGEKCAVKEFMPSELGTEWETCIRAVRTTPSFLNIVNQDF